VSGAWSKRLAADVLSEHMGKPFREYLSAVKVPDRLQSMIIYSLAGASTDQTKNATHKEPLLTKVAVARLRALLSSLGRYSPGAHLYPSYGIGEVPQAFTRLCAVHGGLYLLRFCPSTLVIDQIGRQGEQKAEKTKRFRGIITTAKQFISADYIVGSRNLLPRAIAGEYKSKLISRCVMFLDGPLKDSGEGTAQSGHACLAVVPPGCLGNDQPVRIMQFDHVSCACPVGMVLVYLSCIGTGDAKKDLEHVVEQLAQTASEAKTCSNLRPMLVASAYYTQAVRRPINKSELPVDGVVIAEDLDYAVDFSGVVENAEAAFKKICPDLEFLPGRKELKTGEDKEGLDALMDFDVDDLASEMKLKPQAQLFWLPALMKART